MERISRILQEIAHYGKNQDGSYTRLGYSPEFRESRNAAQKLMESYGMETSTDAAGNVRGILWGTDKAAKHILMGSHLDTVPSGGLFDGAYGVAAALGAVERLQQEGRKLRHTVEVYGFNAEEGGPLGGPFGSRALAGLVDPQQFHLAEALAAYGHTVEEILACARDFSDVLCYLETHVEQGGVLEQQGIPIGVVSGIAGIGRYQVTALGQSNHGGTTPMRLRRDAMVAMAMLIVYADAQCREIDPALVFTPGKVTVYPGAANVVPGKVVASFEMRHVEKARTDELLRRIEAKAKEIPDADFTIEKVIYKSSAHCAPALQDMIRQAAAEAGAAAMTLPSGAGHDADSLDHRVPIGMIFVPSHLGISHSGDEWTEPQAVEQGGDILYRTLLKVDAAGLAE